jgi:predicted component of type VI protein secretion system
MIHEFPAGGASVQMAIWETISVFEPRLVNVRVQQIPSDSPLVLCFEIAGVLAIGRGREPFRVRTQLHASGHVDMR